MGCIGVGAGKYLGVRRIFARISPNLPEKFLGKFLRISSHEDLFGLTSKRRVPFLQIKQGWAPVLPVFSSSLPRFSRILKSFHRFCPDFHGFCPDFQRFNPNFHQIKTFGGALSPPAHPPSSPLMGCV